MASIYYLFVSLLFACHSIIAIDVMSYAANHYSIVYPQYINLSGQYYPLHGSPFEEKWNVTAATAGWTNGFFLVFFGICLNLLLV